MRLLVTLALRNLLRHKRRTLLTAAALVMGIAIMILGRAWQDATSRAVVEPAKLSTLGHVQVFAEDAAADEGGEISFIAPQNNYRLLRRAAEAHRHRPARGAAAPGGDRAAHGRGPPLLGRRVDGGPPHRHRSRAPAPRPIPPSSLREGRFFEPGEKGILLNRGVARKLGVGVGGTVVALGTTADGRLSGVKLTVTGVWKVGGLDAYEWGSCFVDLAAVQELLDAGDAAGRRRLPPDETATCRPRRWPRR